MRTLFCLCALVTTMSAKADFLPLPAHTPTAYVSECGSCHLAYPPVLLASENWLQLLENLDNHFGSEATLSPEIHRELKNFLANNGGNASRIGATGEPPRITRSNRFLRKHRKLPSHYWQDPRVRSAANCEACHTRAGSGSYSEHDMNIGSRRK